MTSVRLARSLAWLILALAVLAAPSASFAQIGVSITVAPPILPVYTQPICPGEGYLWTPGYWGWDDGDYYWVPGTWVTAPEPGLLWTPGYWGWGNGAYLWNAGYWGANVGFYGGVNYGFGYMGTGFEGGYWQGGNFFYNTSVMNVNRTIIHNTYNKTVINRGGSHVSYNGGTGGIRTRPTAEQERFAKERHVEATSEQTRQREAAAGDRSLRASVNHGRPPVAATARAGEFKTGAVAARGATRERTTAKTTERTEKSERAARTERTEKKTGTRTARTEPKSSPAKTEHETARRTEAKPAPARSERAAKAEPKAPKPAKTEHETAKREEAKPAPARHESALKEAKAPKPAKVEHESAPKEAKAPKPAKVEHESAPKPEHQSAPKAESRPAPEEKKPR